MVCTNRIRSGTFRFPLLTPYLARDLTLDAALVARSSRTSTRNVSPAQVKKLLDSRNDRDILDGLRKVISVRWLTLLRNFGRE